MKILIIPDLHGKTYWKNAVNEIEYDKVIFMGDYFDSFFLDDDEIIQNFLNVINFKIKNLDKVVLLIGNHDLSYLYHDDIKRKNIYYASGYRSSVLKKIKKLNIDNSLFDMSYLHNNILFTHAGLTKKWLESNLVKKYILKNSLDINNINHTLNYFLTDKEGRKLLFHASLSRGGKNTPGPLWADWFDLSRELGELSYNQIVGHTPKYDMIQVYDDNTNIRCVDCLDYNNKFLIINDIITDFNIVNILYSDEDWEQYNRYHKYIEYQRMIQIFRKI